MSRLSPAELAELQATFSYVTNYESDDPFEPIDPITYVAPDGDTCLHVAARRGDVRAAELLIKAGVDINRKGDMSCTPLHCAKTKEMVMLLLANGAATDIVNEFGRSPIGQDDRPQ